MLPSLEIVPQHDLALELAQLAKRRFQASTQFGAFGVLRRVRSRRMRRDLDVDPGPNPPVVPEVVSPIADDLEEPRGESIGVSAVFDSHYQFKLIYHHITKKI